MELEDNGFDSETTSQFFSSMMQAESLLKNRVHFNLKGSSNFDADETCELFGHFINAFTNLGGVIIENQKGDREINVRNDEDRKLILFDWEEKESGFMSMPLTKELDDEGFHYHI